MLKYLTLCCAIGVLHSCGQNQPDANALKTQAIHHEISNQQEARFALRDSLRIMAEEGKPQLQGSMTAVDGSQINMNSLAGKLVVMDFWASWCGPCIERIPHFYELAKKYDPEKASFVLVNIDAEKAHWQQFVEEKQWTKESYWIGEEGSNNPLIGYAYSLQGEGDTAYTVLGIPKYVAINKAGLIAGHYMPHEAGEALDKWVAKLFGE